MSFRAFRSCLSWLLGRIFSKWRTLRAVRGVGIIIALLAVFILMTFAIPIPLWRTGQLPTPPLPLEEGGSAIDLPRRIWIDTDAACGHGRTVDPDDCFAILLLAQQVNLTIAGISTVHGNASIEATDRTTRALVVLLEREGASPPPVYRGSAEPMGDDGTMVPAPAHGALRRALEGGPLTNVATALNGRPDLQAKVARLITVMGRRLGHPFHPAEGAGGGLLFGHGPVFRDFNFDQDRFGAASVFQMRLPTTLIPYEVARRESLNADNLARLGAHSGAATWVVSRARAWLDFWKDDIGKEGFYPFDLMAGAYVVAPRLFGCAEVSVWVGKDDRLGNWFHDPQALLVGLEREKPAQVQVSGAAVYCPEIAAGFHGWLMSQFTASQVKG